MGWTDRFRRKPALESRAEWGSSAIPLPNEGNANTYANVDLRRADSSLQKVAVWAAVTLLARLVSSLPLDTYRRRGDGPPANIGNSRFLDDPAGDGQGLPDWLSQYMMSVLLRGNVYGKQILGPDAYPTQIVLYHPDTVDGWRDLYTGQVHWYVEGKDLGASGVWHRRAYPMPGNLLGMSPIGLHMTTIGQGMAAARFGYQFFADGAMPTGMLRNTEVAIDKRVADIAKARWMAAMHGSREVAVMGKGWEYQAIQVAPEESQFLETQKYTAAECARIYGPGVPEILGYETGGSMTYANVDQRSLHLLIYSLDPWLTGLERMFTAMLPQPQFVKFNRAALLRMTTDQRYAAYQTASLIGLQTPNEQRAMEDWGPVPWGDKPWVPAQQAPPPGPTSARSQISVRTEDPWDEESAALLVALAQLDDEEGFAQRAWDAGKHPRIPKGEPGGGRFLSLVEQFKTAIKKHAEGGGGGHPLDGFNREQLRRVAKARGIELKRGEDRDSIAAKLLGHLGDGVPAEEKAHHGTDQLPWLHNNAEDVRQAMKMRQGGDGALAEIMKQQGFDKPPRVVGRSEMDRLVKSGHVELWRGVDPGMSNHTAGLTGREMNEQLRRGAFHPGRGMYGNGTYTSVDRRVAEVYAGFRDDPSPSRDNLVRLTIDPRARIVGRDELLLERDAYLRTVENDTEASILADEGRFAATRGYDVVVVRGHSDGSDVIDPATGNDDYAQYVILNRGILVVQEETP